MIDLLITHANEVVTCRTGPAGAIGKALEKLEIIPNGAVAIDHGRIVDLGPTPALLKSYDARRVLRADAKLVTPGLVDPHSHLVHAGSRHEEYEALVTGKRHAGGGILYTVSKTRQASSSSLRKQALSDLDIMLLHGTTTMEAKSGYGLDRKTELLLMKIISGLKHPIQVVPTYLGDHVLPREYRGRRDKYVDLVIRMLDEVRPYAEYFDIVCGPASFTYDECYRMGSRALELGYRIRVHADEIKNDRGAQLAARLKATSADHLDYVTKSGIRALAKSGTVGVLLPGVTFHKTEMIPKMFGKRLLPAVKSFWPRLVRDMINGGMRLALSADYNPGSSPTQSMQMIMQLAARLYRLSYAAIWHMSTINAAHALDRGGNLGSLEVGKRADIVIWRVPEHGMVIHRFGINLVDTVLKDGSVVVSGGSLHDR